MKTLCRQAWAHKFLLFRTLLKGSGEFHFSRLSNGSAQEFVNSLGSCSQTMTKFIFSRETSTKRQFELSFSAFYPVLILHTFHILLLLIKIIKYFGEKCLHQDPLVNLGQYSNMYYIYIEILK